MEEMVVLVLIILVHFQLRTVILGISRRVVGVVLVL
tara:strand:- start:186 stop:293 length:108 start_codon:yes stop_codon:yes gene_type:complete